MFLSRSPGRVRAGRNLPFGLIQPILRKIGDRLGGVSGFSGSRLSSLDFFGRIYMCVCMMGVVVQWFLAMTAEGER